MSDEKKPKQYIKYTAAELAGVPSPHQMEQEMERLRQDLGLGSLPFGNVAEEYLMYKTLGRDAYIAKKRAEARRLF